MQARSRYGRNNKPSILPFAGGLAAAGVLTGAFYIALNKPFNEPEAYFGSAYTSDGEKVEFSVRGRFDIPNEYTKYDRDQLRVRFDQEAAAATRSTVQGAEFVVVDTRPVLISQMVCASLQTVDWEARMTKCSVSFK